MFSFNQQNFQNLMSIFMDVVKNSSQIVTTKMAYDKTVAPLLDETNPYDYFRWRTMQLCSEMINNDPELANSDACVAEAGVWRGGFSYLINAAFKDRSLHLFDTFEGFNKEQVNHDYDKGLIDNFFKDQQDFNSTSIDLVKSILPFKEQAVFHKGLFEETCNEVKDLKFVFTSLDMDLKLPMANALKFFYERTLPGGFIFMHDYNHCMIRGIKEVVSEYEQKHGRLNKLPIADEGGSLIIIKSKS